MRKMTLFLALFLTGHCSFSQYVLNGNYSQDFNNLLTSGSGNSLPAGWVFVETGSAADALYTAGTGSGSTGDTYSFGIAAAADRALGGLQSGTLQPLFGFYFSNGTGQLITRIHITYTGEQWRLGATGRNDRLDFQFSLNATSLSNGDWADLDMLDFITPVSTAPTGALDGNAVSNKRTISATITGLQIAPGSTCFFRWVDPDASGADDGLAIDDLLIEPGFAVPSSLYYRTKASGNWSALDNWEVSADQMNWSAATELPGRNTAGIRIRNGHTINHQYFTQIDQLIIETGGLLQHSGGQLSIYDGDGDDLRVENGAVFQLSAAGNLPLFSDPAATVRLMTGAILRISAGGLTTIPGGGVHSVNYVYEHASILENAYNGMGANGITYFPNVSNNTIPVLRITQPITLPVGAVAATRVNGVLEVNGNVSFTASGQKIFRNGIRGSATLTTTAFCGMLIIDGATAVLGGSGLLNLSASTGLQLGSGTTITLLQDKTLNGNISLGTSSSYIELGAYRLNVTGTVSGGGPAAFIRTAGEGMLMLENVPAAGKLFPVGHTRYNPVMIGNGSGHHWAVRVNDGIVPDFPFTSDGAVLLTWHIQPSVDPPAAGADITFRFDQSVQTGSMFNTAPFDNEPVQAWRRSNGFWLSAGVPQPLVDAGGSIRTVKISGLSSFADMGLSRLSLPLPVKLISFQALPLAPGMISLQWKIAEPGKAIFIPEYAVNASDFKALDTILSVPGKTEFAYPCSSGREADQYYRLKILEPDGKVHYSHVVKLNTGEPDDIRFQLQENPVTLDALLQVQSKRSVSVMLYITDVTGKMVYHEPLWIKIGAQTFHLPSASLPAGLYFLHMESDNWRRTIRVIKQ